MKMLHVHGLLAGPWTAGTGGGLTDATRVLHAAARLGAELSGPGTDDICQMCQKSSLEYA